MLTKNYKCFLPNFCGFQWIRKNTFCGPDDVIKNGRRDLKKYRGTSSVREHMIGKTRHISEDTKLMINENHPYLCPLSKIFIIWQTLSHKGFVFQFVRDSCDSDRLQGCSAQIDPCGPELSLEICLLLGATTLIGTVMRKFGYRINTLQTFEDLISS